MPNTPSILIQDSFLAELRDAKAPVTLFMINGFQVRGYIERFDSYTVMVNSEDTQQILYKHMISTILPFQPGARQPKRGSGSDLGRRTHGRQ